MLLYVFSRSLESEVICTMHIYNYIRDHETAQLPVKKSSNTIIPSALSATLINPKISSHPLATAAIINPMPMIILLQFVCRQTDATCSIARSKRLARS